MKRRWEKGRREGYHGTHLILELGGRGVFEGFAIARGGVKVNGQVCAELELSFAFLDDRFGATGLFPPEDLLRTLRILKLFDVAVDQNGNRIHPPEHMLEAERQAAREFVLSRAVAQSKPYGL